MPARMAVITRWTVVLVRMWRNWNSHDVLVGIKMVQPLFFKRFIIVLIRLSNSPRNKRVDGMGKDKIFHLQREQCHLNRPAYGVDEKVFKGVGLE